VTSHQVAGWDDFPLAQWTRDTFGLPVVVNNDCDAAALAEARLGAAAGKRIVFYVTVGTGVGGGLVIDAQIHRGGRGVAAEIGHLRPGLHCESAEQTVEAAVAGPGIVASVRETIERFGVHLQNPYGRLPRIGELAQAEPDPNEPLPPALRQWCGDPARDGEVLRDIAQLDALDGGDAKKLTAKDIFVAASQGNHIAAAAVTLALRTLGWAIAQTVTLVAPDIVVVGGGVSLAGEMAFFAPLREEAARFTFPPLRESYTIVPAALGEEVVVHGAILAARDALGAT
jgi:glucokinase